MHIPTCQTQELEILTFEQALVPTQWDFDREKWLYIPDHYAEYRYLLGTRGENPLICIGINPSTAVPGDLDNTLKSVERIAAGNGYDSFLMFNVYAQRATRPEDMDAQCNQALHRENMTAFRYVLSQVGADFTPADGWLMGLGAHMISLKPRTSTEWKEQTFKVNERMTAFSYEAHLKYSGRNYTFAAKTLMASALDHTALLGGYGVSSVDSRTGEQGYTPFRHSTTWVNFAYGTKWRPGVFVGYTKNLGTGKSLVSADKVYGMGLDIDQLITVSLNVSYNLPHWKFGFEYCPATAYYGTTDLESGRIEQTHAITNHRILGLMMYYF